MPPLCRSKALSIPRKARRRPIGLNNEQLPDRLQEALRRVVFQFSTESELSRRQEIRRIKQAHQFWRGLQYLWWDERDQNWHLPFEQKLMDNSSIEDMPRYEFVTNIYQAFGLSLIAVLSQDVPSVRFFPSSAQAEEDVAAAKAATEVSGLVERNNRIGNLIVDEAFNLWTDGKVGAYVRFVVDGQRFGFHPETEIGAREVKLGDDVYVCPECGAENLPTADESKHVPLASTSPHSMTSANASSDSRSSMVRPPPTSFRGPGSSRSLCDGRLGGAGNSSSTSPTDSVDDILGDDDAPETCLGVMLPLSDFCSDEANTTRRLRELRAVRSAADGRSIFCSPPKPLPCRPRKLACACPTARK